MQYKFNIAVSDGVNSDFDGIKQTAKSHLNYGWEYVSIEKAGNEHLPYRITLNWKKQGLPDIDPYGDHVLRFSEEQ